MSLPKINIAFSEAANTFIERSTKGVLVLIIKDDGVEEGVYSLYSEFDIDENLTDKNQKFVKRGFTGAENKPQKVILCVMGTEETTIDTALESLETIKFDYIAPPSEATEEEINSICEWIKKEREAGHWVKGVLPGVAADDEAIINFANNVIKTSSEEFNGKEFCSRIAGLLCGTPITQSATFSVLEEVTEVDSFTKQELEMAVDAGKFVAFHDGEKVKIASAVTSLTSKASKISAFKKIKILEAADMIRSDIQKTVEDKYIGKFANSYDNKCVLMVAINTYLDELVREGILKEGAKVEIDTDAQRKYLLEKGVDVSEMSLQDIKEANTGENVFLKANLGILDAIENVNLAITI